MRAVLIHADHTECHHDGPPGTGFGVDGGPLCPDGREIGWVQLDDRTLAIDAAYASIQSMAAAITQALSPMAAATARMCARFTTDPAVRAFAAAAAVIDQARAAEETRAAQQQAHDQRPPSTQKGRGFGGDPCGSPGLEHGETSAR